MASRKDLARFLLADTKKVTIVTHKTLTNFEGHKQHTPQEIEQCLWEGDDIEGSGPRVEGELVFKLDVGGEGLVPLDHKAFSIYAEASEGEHGFGVLLLTDNFHETKDSPRRFYELVIDVASRRGEFTQGR